LEISRNTVERIFSEAEMSTLVQEGKSKLYECIPEAAEIYGSKVKSDPGEAKDFLERGNRPASKDPAKQCALSAANLRDSEHRPSEEW